MTKATLGIIIWDESARFPLSEETLMYPVATWKLHDITKLPICWLFGEYDREGEHVAFVYDGEVYRLYEGSQSQGLLPVEGVEVYGRRWDDREDMDYPEKFNLDDACGVEIVLMKDGLHLSTLRIGAGDIGISPWGMRRHDMGEVVVDGLFVELKNYIIDITPDRMTISER